MQPEYGLNKDHEFIHGFKIDHAKCSGMLSCMRVCPTHAIRVKNGKARVLSELCIDCGSCLKACPSGAISATTHSLKEEWKFRYKVVIPSPVLFGQFPIRVSPAHIIAGIKALGFDAVWLFADEIALVNRAIRDYVKNWKGRFPLISSSCPVIVRLIQVSYPELVEQLIPIQPPRELAGRELKRRYAEKLGISRDEIAAIYVTSCQAKTISILEPAEGVKSDLDGSIGISDLYNGIFAHIKSSEKTQTSAPLTELIKEAGMLQWTMGEAQRLNLHGYRVMSLTGLVNNMSVFDDIEAGKIRDIDFLECYSCWGGCTNGNLTVDNLYVARSRLQRLINELPNKDPLIEEAVEKRYPNEDVFIRAPIKPRPIKGYTGDLKERIERLKAAEAILAKLPGLDCGLCGAPGCKTLAKDIALGDAKQTECIFFSKGRIDKLRSIYLKK